MPRASGPVFTFCALGIFFGGTVGVVSRFHVLHARTHFRRYRGRRGLFSCFARPDSFSTVPRASDPVFIFCAPGLISAVPRATGPFFMFCAPGLVLDGIDGVWSRFHLLRSRTNFRRYRGRRVPFSSFARPDSFPAVPRTSGPIFKFCTPELIFGGIEGVRSLFQVMPFQTHFRRYR
jgi:hypothetical protein